MAKYNSRLIYNKIKLAYGLTTDTDLAKFLDVKQSTLASIISRDSINWDNLFEKCNTLSIDWLLHDKGDMFLNPSKKSSNDDLRTIAHLNELIEKLNSELKDTKAELTDLKSKIDSK